MRSIRTYKGGVALITGAGSGLGRALAVELAQRGASLFLSDVDTHGLEQTAERVKELGGAVHLDRIDVRDAAAVREWVERPERIDYLFNNAGIVGVGGLTDRYAPGDWEAVIDVNLKGVVNGVHAGYPVMARRGFGHIVNTASVAGLMPFPLALPYCATKHAVVGLSKSLRIEAARKGVRVSALCPGAVRTPILTSGRMRSLEGVPDDRILAWWERWKPIDPEPWARETLDLVARNEALIIVPRSIRFMAALFWLFPGRAERKMQRAFHARLRYFPELDQARQPLEARSAKPRTHDR